MRCAGAIAWDYDRTEPIADGIVHVIGVGLDPLRRSSC